MRDLLPAGWMEGGAPLMARNGEPARLNELVQPGDVVDGELLPTGNPAIVLGQQLAGLVQGVVQGAVSIGTVQLAGRLLVESLLPSPPGRSRTNENQVYGWGGIRAEYLPLGTPVPRVLGGMRMGPAIIGQNIEIVEGDDGPESYLSLLCLLGKGPFESIGGYTTDQDDLSGSALPAGLQIAGNDAKNLAGVQAWVRMGTLTQTPIPGFEFVTRLFDVGLDLTNGDGSGGDPVFDDWTYGVAYTMPAGVEGDRGAVVLTFPEGLFRVANDGSLKKRPFEFQIRIQKVDDMGVPFGSTVTYPSETTSFVIEEKITNAFQRQIPFDFVDPETYTPANFNTAVTLSGGDYLEDASWGAFSGYCAAGHCETDPDTQEFAFFGIFRIDTLETRIPLVSMGTWNENEATPRVQGFILSGTNAGDGTATIRLWAGGGVAASPAKIIEAEGLIAEGSWFSAAVVYDKNDILGHRIDLYINATLIGTAYLDEPIQWDDTAVENDTWLWNVFPEKSASGNAWFGQITIAEQALFNSRKSGTEIAGLHALGAWVSQRENPDRLFVVHMETPINGSGFIVGVDYNPAFGTGSGANWEMQGAAVAVDPGPVQKAGTQDGDRARYRVEMQRTNEDSDNTQNTDDATWDALLVYTDDRIGYVDCAIMALRILATGQLNSNRPNVTVPVEGEKCPIWDGVSETNPGFTTAFTRNPAWQTARMLSDPDSPFGAFYTLQDGLRLDLFKRWADYADERVYDMRGRLLVTRLEAVDNGDGTYDVRARVALPLPDHWGLGVEMKLRNVVPGAFPFADAVGEITSIEDVDPSTVDVRIGGLITATNQIVGGNDFESFVAAGSAPTVLLAENSTDPEDLPPGLFIPVADKYEVTGNGVATRRWGYNLTGLDTAKPLFLSVSFRVTGPGLYRAALNINGTQVDGGFIDNQPADGEWRTLTFTYPQAPVASGEWRFVFKPLGSYALEITLANAQADEVDAVADAPAYTEVPGSVVTPQNMLADPNATDSSVWDRVAGVTGKVPELLQANVETEPLPFPAPGLPELWRWTDNQQKLRQTVSIAAGDHYAAVWFKVADLLGTIRFRLRAGGVQTGSVEVPNDGEWHLVSDIIAAGATDQFDIELASSVGQRDVLVGAAFLDEASAATGYDDGASLAELFAVEPRLESDIVFADRGQSAFGALTMLMAAGRAAPFQAGDRVGVRLIAPSDPVALFTPSNILPDTFERACDNPQARTNSIVGEIQARDNDYERLPIQRDHPSLELGVTTQALQFRQETVDLRGITRRSQAVRELDARLELSQRSCEQVSFETDVDGLGVEPGDVITLALPIADWGDGAKAYEDAADGTTISPDLDVLLGRTANLLANARDLTAGDWQAAATSEVNEPTVIAEAAAEPAVFGEEFFAFEIQFPAGAGINSRVRQQVPSWGVGQEYAGHIWARAKTGTVATVSFEMVSFSQVLDAETPTLTTEWTKILLSGTAAFDEDVFFRVKKSDGAAGAAEVYVARPRMILGADDSINAAGPEFTGGLPTLYAAVRYTDTDVLAFRRLRHRSGLVPQGGTIYLADALDQPVAAGDVFTCAPLAMGRRFLVTETTLTEAFTRRIRAILYVDALFRDADEYETTDVEITTGAGGQESAAQAADFNPDSLPERVVAVGAWEEAVTDEDTGNVERSVLVSWRFERTTAYRVARVRVWARVGTDPPEMMVEVDAAHRTARIPGDAFKVRRGDTVEVIVQPVTLAGLRPPLRVCQRTTLAIAGYFPLPQTPAGGSVATTGLEALYTVDMPARVQAGRMEIVRGGVFIHQTITRLGAGSPVYGPTYNFVDVPSNVFGDGNPPVRARLVGPDGHPGQYVALDQDLDLSAWPAAVAEDAWEDVGGGPSTTPWDDHGTLDADLDERVAGDGSDRVSLEFDAASVALEASWVSAAVDIGRARRVHVSVGIDGEQVHPRGFDDLPALDSRRGLRWSLEGPLDPGDASYGAAVVVIEARTSDTSDPTGGTWRQIVPGPAYLRSIQFRLRFVRPATDYNARVWRGAFRIRPFPASDSVLNDEITS